jgi:hypothetical protein
LEPYTQGPQSCEVPPASSEEIKIAQAPKTTWRLTQAQLELRREAGDSQACSLEGLALPSLGLEALHGPRPGTKNLEEADAVWRPSHPGTREPEAEGWLSQGWGPVWATWQDPHLLKIKGGNGAGCLPSMFETLGSISTAKKMQQKIK